MTGRLRANPQTFLAMGYCVLLVALYVYYHPLIILIAVIVTDPAPDYM